MWPDSYTSVLIVRKIQNTHHVFINLSPHVWLIETVTAQTLHRGVLLGSFREKRTPSGQL